VSLLTAQVAQAQDNTPSDESSGGHEIIVTAQFRAQNLQDTPVAITAVNAEMLEARNQTNIKDIATQAPNVSIDQTPAGYGASAQVTIRGVGQTDSSLALEPGVGIYIDDVYYSTVFGNVFDLLDLDRVEILRGPQGTLAGKNSIGGAIKLFNKKPGPQTDGFIEATYGSYNLAKITGASSFTILPDQLYARVSGSFSHRDGYVTQYDYACLNPGKTTLPLLSTTASGCVLGHEGGGNDVSLRGALRWVPSDSLEININGDYSNFDDEPTPNTLVLAETRPSNSPQFGANYHDFQSPDPYTTYATYADGSFVPPRKVALKAWGVSGTVDLKLSDTISLKSITAYRDHSGELAQDTDASPLPMGLSYNPISIKQFTQEVRLNANIADAIDLTVGGFYFDGKGRNWGRSVQLPLDFQLNDLQSSTSYSGFAHATWAVTDRLNLTGGLRYSNEEKHFQFGRVNPLTQAPPCSYGVCDVNGVSGVAKTKRVDYRAVVDYRWSDQLMTYAQFSTGFKGGGINPRPYYQNQVAPFGPESINAYEIGFKADFLDRTLRFNVAAFYNDYKDIQIRTQGRFFNVNLPIQNNSLLPLYNPFEDAFNDNTGLPYATPVTGTSPSGVTQNAGKAKVKGIEAELSYEPGSGLMINAAVSYLDFQFVDLDPTSQAYVSGIRDTYITAYTPKWKASIGVQYELEIGSAGTITPRVDYSYQSEMWSNAINSNFNHLAPRNMVNARLTYEAPDKDWQVALEVSNLTNERYYQSLFDFYNAQGTVTGVPVRPREWAVSVKRRF
jgi:iron complex outermembrane receptor protein